MLVGNKRILRRTAESTLTQKGARNPLSDMNKILYGRWYPRIITCVIFSDDWLSGYMQLEISPFSIGFCCHPYNTRTTVCMIPGGGWSSHFFHLPVPTGCSGIKQPVHNNCY